MVVRQSNFELFRIVTMLGIVFHHGMIHSALYDTVCSNPWSWNSSAILWLGAWGKTGINCFVLLTGYFMCEKRLTVLRLAKLIGLTEFYAFLVYGVKVLLGAELSWSGGGDAARLFFSGIGGNFVSSFIVLMLLVPILNWLIYKMSSLIHLIVATAALFVLSVLPSLGIKTNTNEVVWFVVLYIVAAYVRRTPGHFSLSCCKLTVLVVCLFALATSSMVFGAWLTPKRPGCMLIHYWVFPDQKIFAFLCAFALFLVFRALDTTQWPRQLCHAINFLASTTFGVYLLHDGTLGLDYRAKLWGILDASSSVAEYVGFALLVFMVCAGVDVARKALVRCVRSPMEAKLFAAQRRFQCGHSE